MIVVRATGTPFERGRAIGRGLGAAIEHSLRLRPRISRRPRGGIARARPRGGSVRRRSRGCRTAAGGAVARHGGGRRAAVQHDRGGQRLRGDLRAGRASHRGPRPARTVYGRGAPGPGRAAAGAHRAVVRGRRGRRRDRARRARGRSGVARAGGRRHAPVGRRQRARGGGGGDVPVGTGRAHRHPRALVGRDVLDARDAADATARAMRPGRAGGYCLSVRVPRRWIARRGDDGVAGVGDGHERAHQPCDRSVRGRGDLPTVVREPAPSLARERARVDRGADDGRRRRDPRRPRRGAGEHLRPPGSRRRR